MKNINVFGLKNFLADIGLTETDMLELIRKAKKDMEYDRDTGIIYTILAFDKGKKFIADDIKILLTENYTVKEIEKRLDVIVKSREKTKNFKREGNSITAMAIEKNIKLSCELVKKTKNFIECDEQGQPIKNTMFQQTVVEKVYCIEEEFNSNIPQNFEPIW